MTEGGEIPRETAPLGKDLFRPREVAETTVRYVDGLDPEYERVVKQRLDEGVFVGGPRFRDLMSLVTLDSEHPVRAFWGLHNEEHFEQPNQVVINGVLQDYLDKPYHVSVKSGHVFKEHKGKHDYEVEATVLDVRENTGLSLRYVYEPGSTTGWYYYNEFRDIRDTEGTVERTEYLQSCILRGKAVEAVKIGDLREKATPADEQRFRAMGRLILDKFSMLPDMYLGLSGFLSTPWDGNYSDLEVARLAFDYDQAGKTMSVDDWEHKIAGAYPVKEPGVYARQMDTNDTLHFTLILPTEHPFPARYMQTEVSVHEGIRDSGDRFSALVVNRGSLIELGQQIVRVNFPKIHLELDQDGTTGFVRYGYDWHTIGTDGENTRLTYKERQTTQMAVIF